MWKNCRVPLASASSARMVPSPRVYSHEDALGAYIKKTGDVNLRQMSPADASRAKARHGKAKLKRAKMRASMRVCGVHVRVRVGARARVQQLSPGRAGGGGGDSSGRHAQTYDTHESPV